MRERLRQRDHLRLRDLRDRHLPHGAECTGAQAGDVCTASTHTCAACTSDNGCQNSYSAAYICVNSACVQGDCHDNTGCSNNGVCLNNSCVPCTADGQCMAGQLCLSGGCVTGNCRQATTDCMNGQVCTANNCVGLHRRR